MKLCVCARILLLLGVNPILASAQTSPLSPSRLNLLDQHGYFTPSFKSAVHDLVDSHQALARARAEEKKFREELPALRKQTADAAAETAKLRDVLTIYAHPEIADFDALQAAMKDPSASVQQRLQLAQLYVWSYPTDPHQAEAATDLMQIEKQISAEEHDMRDAATNRVAAHAALVRRAKAGDLTLKEWRQFLRDMSQEDLLAFLGPPQVRNVDCWIYDGAWTSDPVTRKRVGLQVNFNGTRVLSVNPKDL